MELVPTLSASLPEDESSGETDKLGDEQCRNKTAGIKTQGQSIIDRHADNRVEPIDAEPVAGRKKKNHPEFAYFPEGGEKLPEPCR